MYITRMHHSKQVRIGGFEDGQPVVAGDALTLTPDFVIFVTQAVKWNRHRVVLCEG
jgi:hypothetical protein